jgi:hypothetical protein
MISDPTMAVKLKRGQKEKIEGALSEAMGQLEIEDTDAEELRKKVRFFLGGHENRTLRQWLTADIGTCSQAYRHQGFLQPLIGSSNDDPMNGR